MCNDLGVRRHPPRSARTRIFFYAKMASLDTNSGSTTLSSESVSLRSGPPTREELVVHYPPKFAFHQLKTFINAGSVSLLTRNAHAHSPDSDLGLLKRDKKLQERYNAWGAGIRQEYGSMGMSPRYDACMS